MFVLTENNFTEKGRCKYIDEFNNKAFFARTKDGFVGKLRFHNKYIIADPIYITVPLKENEDGVPLHMEYAKGVEQSGMDIQEGINGFNALMNNWIQMLYDIKFMEMPNSFLMKNNPDATEEDVLCYKLQFLEKYDELKSTLTSVFSNKS